MSSFIEHLTPINRLRYAWWRARGRRGGVTLALRSGPVFQLRPDGRGWRGNDDYGVAYDVFVHRHYDPPGDVRLGAVSRVVDLGGNVGFSVLHWLSRHPGCRVAVFEPHPRHVAQIRAHLALNGWEGRVEVHPVAAGVAAGTLPLSDKGSCSSLQSGAATAGCLEVAVVDLFQALDGETIDILKMDIEGGEYAILADPRFRELPVRGLVMEWHGRTPGGEDRTWCLNRLAELGYHTREVYATPSNGVIWAFRDGVETDSPVVTPDRSIAPRPIGGHGPESTR